MDTTATEPIRVWADVEATELDLELRRAWDIAAIVRRPGEPDVEFQCFVDVSDLDLQRASPISLEIGRFWQRHPQAADVAAKLPYGRLREVTGKLPGTPPTGTVLGEHEALKLIAQLTADRAVVCGSNPAYDTYTLEARMAAYGIDPAWHYHPTDVPDVARGWLLGRGMPAPRKSDDIAQACGINLDGYERHTALGDCRLFRDLSDLIEPRTDLITA